MTIDTALSAARAAQREYMRHAWLCEASQFCQEHRRLSLTVEAAYARADAELEASQR